MRMLMTGAEMHDPFALELNGRSRPDTPAATGTQERAILGGLPWLSL
jgi:hypothetical protein